MIISHATVIWRKRNTPVISIHRYLVNKGYTGIYCFVGSTKFQDAAIYIRTFIVNVIKLFHRIRISEILPWDRKSYLTHAILPRLSHEGFILLLYLNSRTLSSSDVIVIFK